MFQGNEWIMGSEFTLVDPYALVFYGWGARSGFPMKELSAYTAWQERMMKRPTVKKTSTPSRTFRHHSFAQVRLSNRRNCIPAAPMINWSRLSQV